MSGRPKLGQHFLSSLRFRQRIADALPLSRGELVIEIGPGRGAMTGLLAERTGRVAAIELDKTLAERLTEDFAASSHVRVIHGDILEADINEICASASAGSCFVFGNLPYYITSPILHHLLEFRARISGMALLMQREVAERVVAKPGSRDFGYLSVLVQLFSQPQILFSVPPGAFSPPPKVHSALVDFRMEPKFGEWSAARTSNFLDFVKLCFAQKRKNLLNNLSSLAPRQRIAAVLSTLELPTTTRGEQLSISQLAALFDAIAARD
jgi:16S rRNA (adenine1518-N6/adenine1519-N6)-dimethyltransferase